MVTGARRRRLARIALGALLALPPSAARPVSAASGDPLERRFLAARELERTGQARQAREIYLELASPGEKTPYQDDALLALARISLQVGGPETPVPADVVPASFDEARVYLETLIALSPEPETAPEAAYWLALLQLDPRAPFFDPAAAQAALTAHPRLYPRSSHSEGALLRASELLVASGRVDPAREMAFRVLAEGIGGADASRAWLVLAEAEARSRRFESALFALGRAVDEAPAGEAARRARDLATIVDRVAFSRARAPELPFAAAGEPIGISGRVSDVTASPEGTLVAVVPRDGQLVSVTPGGEISTRPVEEPAAASYDRWGRLWVALPGRLEIAGGGRPIPLPPRARVVSLAPSGPGSAWIADADARQVVRLGAQGKIEVTLPLPPRADPLRVAPAIDGGVWVLEGRGPTLLGYGPGGEERKVIPLADRVERPIDLESDPLGNLYLLASKPLAVYVFDPSGTLAMAWEPRVADPGKDFPRPAALAVDGAGGFALYDSRLESARWWR